MDANGTRFHLLLGDRDWLACTDVSGRSLPESGTAVPPWGPLDDGLEWNDERTEVTLRPFAFEFRAAPGDNPPRLEDRRGSGRDVYGNLYWIASSRTEIRVKSIGSGTVSHFWAVGDGLRCERHPRYGDFAEREPLPAPADLLLGGLAVTTEHYLLVGVLDPRGFLVFDLHAGGPPRQIYWPKAVPFSPFDVSPSAQGGVLVLDRAERRVWALDRRFEVTSGAPPAASPLRGDFASLGGVAPRPCISPSILSLDAAVPLDAEDPIAIEALADGSVLVLDRAPSQPTSRLQRYRAGTRVADVPLDALRSHAHDMAFVPAAEGDPPDVLGRLDVVDAEGNQAFAFRLKQSGDALVLDRIEEYLPLRLFGGKGLAAGGGRVFYDLEDDFIPLVPQFRPRYARRGVLVTPIFDGREPRCVWHRLMLDATVPRNTGIEVWSRAASEREDVPTAAWRKEPTPQQRRTGSELPFLSQPGTPCTGTWETLFQETRGRFLQLKLELSGSGRATPRLRALRIYYPRFSYLGHYLPGVYREEAGPASFLERFLANLEGFYTSIEDRIAAAQVLMDVDAAPAEALSWLADWYGVAHDPTWDEDRRRLFLRHAMHFFQYRGTVHGLEMALALVLCDRPDESIFSEAPRPEAGVRIVERFRMRQLPPAAVGDPTEVIGPRRGIATQRWQPVEGGAGLRTRYASFLAPSLPQGAAAPDFPLAAPSDPALASAWRDFCLFHLGFVPAGGAADPRLWQDFLARRYRRVGALNDAYGAIAPVKELADARPFATLPPDGPPLVDWYDFESVVLAMRRLAHQFRILIPVRHTDTTDPVARRDRLALVGRVVALEKPAHTVFDVRLYWALFRVGEARLGEDTLIHLGGRSPDLLRPLVLSDAHLGESYLAPAHPQDVRDRTVLGQGRLTAAVPTGIPA